MASNIYRHNVKSKSLFKGQDFQNLATKTIKSNLQVFLPVIQLQEGIITKTTRQVK